MRPLSAGVADAIGNGFFVSASLGDGEGNTDGVAGEDNCCAAGVFSVLGGEGDGGELGRHRVIIAIKTPTAATAAPIFIQKSTCLCRRSATLAPDRRLPRLEPISSRNKVSRSDATVFSCGGSAGL